VHVPHTTCGAFMAFIAMKKIAEGEPQMAIMATLGTELYTKYVVVVDDDVDIFNINDVMWAPKAPSSIPPRIPRPSR
jgi:2,5-furandicarboxylate decarboxylase 1